MEKNKIQDNEFLMNLQQNEFDAIKNSDDHPNLIKVFELMEDANHYYLVMELI